MTDRISKIIDDTGVIAVVTVDHEDDALPLANSLLEGGVDTIELTLRTPAAISVGRIIKKELPEINLGFGTVINIDQVKQVVDIGADFAVSPGCNVKIIKEAKKHGLPFAPGIMTPSDIEAAIECGCKVLKFFPAESSGGINHLKSMAAPYSYLGLKFIPLGGVNMNNARIYLESYLVTAVGGSWLAKPELIKGKKWDNIKENAQNIRAMITEIKQNQ